LITKTIKKLIAMRKQVLITTFVVVSNILHAQSDNPFVQSADSMMVNLNKTYITTGILYDRVAPLAGLDLFNSQTDTSTYSLFMQAYFEMYYASYNITGWQSPDLADSVIWDNNVSGILPIGVLDYQFNMMDSLAVQNNLLSYQNGLLYDVQGRPNSPYFLKRIQLVAPLANSINTGTVKLKYLPQLYKTNVSLVISSITITGLTESTINLPLNGTTTDITITSPGVKTIQIQVIYSNGEQFTRTCSLQVEGTNLFSRTMQTEAGPLPNDSYWLSSTISFQGYDEPAAYCGKNKISIYSRGTDNTLKPIIKPIIILDGFDPTNKRGAPEIYKDAFAYINGNNQPANFADELRASGFDIIVVDHPSYNNDIRTINDPSNLLSYPPSTINGGGDYVQRNAMVFVALIQRINSQLQANGSNEKLIIVGPSMGGQISRWALRYMEVNGMTHNCKLWVSFDSPHQGALLPIGIQYLAAGFSSISKAAKTSLNVQINCPDAKEALIHHHLGNQELPTGAPGFKDRYYQELDNLGWPIQCRKIAMISGSDKGIMVQPGSPGMKAIDVELKLRLAARLLLWGLRGFISNPVLVKGEVYLAPSQQQNRGSVFDGRIIFRNLTTRYSIAPTYSGQTIDLVPSGFYPGFTEIKESSDKNWSGQFLNRLASQNFNALLSVHAHEFVWSTLALGKGPFPNPNRKWDDDISNINVTCGSEKESPFDAYWGPDINTRHDSLLYGHVIRLRDEFNGIPMANKTITQTINGNSTGTMCTNNTTTFQILNPKSGQTFIWGTSQSNLVIASGQGTSSIQVQYTGGTVSGSAYISCQSSASCYNINVSNFSLQSVHFGGYSSSDYPVSGPSSACNNTYVYFSTNTLPGATDYAWFWPASDWTYISGNHTPNLALRTGTASGPVGVRVANACDAGGSPGMKYVQVNNCGFYFTVSPNPSKGNVTVSTESQTLSETSNGQDKIYQIKIIDQLGIIKKQFSYSGGITITNINLSNLAVGIYTLQAYNGTIWSSQQIVKQ
jgi:pimeloyl-ACP methyl ester carboxylesterase